MESIVLNPIQTNPCAFCDEKVIQKQLCYEDEDTLILYSHKPIIQGHCLVIPKRHVEFFQDMSSSELISLHKNVSKLFQAASKSYNATSYILLQKNGREAGQSVPHVHFHFLPRKEGGYSDLGVLFRVYISTLFKPISQKQMDLERALIAKNIEIDHSLFSQAS